ncbi:MAG: hypothetical protein QOJ40_2912 [Verrucomicrobiota bacterium]
MGGMKSVVYKTDGSRGGFITASIIPANRRHESKFGVLDAIIVITLLACTSALLRLVLMK